MGAQQGGEGVPMPTFWNRKSVLIVERKALIVYIFGLNFPFKI